MLNMLLNMLGIAEFGGSGATGENPLGETIMAMIFLVTFFASMMICGDAMTETRQKENSFHFLLIIVIMPSIFFIELIVWGFIAGEISFVSD